MYRSAPLDRTPSDTDRASVIVTCVHGTWARGSRWPALEAAVAEGLGADVRITLQRFEWSGRNSVKARTRAARDLRYFLLAQILQEPLARHVLVAHSHGANVTLHAIGDAEDSGSVIRDALSGIVLLSPPLLDCRVVDAPAAAANKLLVAALAIVPVLIVLSNYICTALGIGGTARLLTLLVLLALWLVLFRPGAVRRRAEGLARQLALPRFDFPGLVVRAPKDEATFALSSVSAFARLARFAWSRVNGARSAFPADERLLREARTFPELATAVFNALVLVPMSITMVTQAQAAASDGRWMVLLALLPFTIVFATAALVIVGGALVLLLLIPAFSLLLWPFGILPALSAALLDVSVMRAPTPAWQVIDVEGRSNGTWRHSVHDHLGALEYVCAYIGQLRADGHAASKGTFARHPSTPVNH